MTAMTARRLGIPATLFATCVLLFTLMSYGGIRSPDSEVVFRVAESVAERGEFDVPEPLIRMGDFGRSQGVDGRHYTFYGPAQSVAVAPLVWLGRALGRTGVYESEAWPVAYSFYVGEGLAEYGAGEPPGDPAAHGVRTVVCSFNAWVSALGVVLLWALARRFGCSPTAAAVGAGLFAFATLTWAYAGTFFKEPLSIVAALAALVLLAGYDTTLGAPRCRPVGFAAAGVCLGLAMAAHVTAAQLFPFWLAYCVVVAAPARRFDRATAVRVGLFVAGFAAVVALLGWFNLARFGDVLETGRRAGQGMPDEALYPPWSMAYWRVISGLMVGGGKGLLVYCPAIVLCALLWRPFHTRHRILSWILVAAVVSRVLALGLSSGWHGGFCLGPRYLVPLLPLAFLPVCVGIDDMIRQGRRSELGRVFVFGALCVVQQLYFLTGEIFSYSHIIKWHHERSAVDVFAADRIYLDWDISPLLHMLKYERGPFLLQGVGVGNVTLWLLLSGAACLLIGLAWVLVCRAAGWQAAREE